MDGRAHACYLLDDDLLIDCGASSILRLHSLKVDLNSIRTVLFTHFHGDHFAGLPFLLLNYQYITYRKSPLLILGPDGIEAMCGRMLDVTYPGMEFSFPIEYKVVQPGIPLVHDRREILGLPVTHREESLGYRITSDSRTFAFSGDSAYDERLFSVVEDADLAVVELSLPENDGSVAHLGLNQVLAGGLRARRIVFSHVYNDLADQAARNGLETASDGSVFQY